MLQRLLTALPQLKAGNTSENLLNLLNLLKLSVFGKNDFRCLSNFLQTHIFWNFDQICRNLQSN